MLFNPRRLEAIDVFFICPQFPIYISPKDANLDPDKTIPDSKARGVYVDTALLLARCTRVRTGAARSIAGAFARAHEDRDLDLFDKIDVTSLEVPILEERKRAPTRHPKDLQDHVDSILYALDHAQRQVLIQAEILFSSRRFSDQNLVILLATGGQYYRIGVVQRDHEAFRLSPVIFKIEQLLDAPELEASDLGEDTEGSFSELVESSTIEKERHKMEEIRRGEVEKQQNETNYTRSAARTARAAALHDLEGRERQRSQLVLEAGLPPYTDGMIEGFFKLSEQSDRRYPDFFEPEPLPNETINSLARLRNPKEDRQVIFSGVIRFGSPVSDKFVAMIRKKFDTYLRRLLQSG